MADGRAPQRLGRRALIPSRPTVSPLPIGYPWLPRDRSGHASEESNLVMSESEPNLPSPSFLERYTKLRETIERRPEQRPAVDPIDAISRAGRPRPDGR